MEYKKVLLSSSFAIALTLTGVAAVQGTANADTTTDTNNAATEQVAQTGTTAEVGKTAEVGVAAPTADVAQTAATADNGDQTTIPATELQPAQEVTATTAGTAATAGTAGTAATSGTAATGATTEQSANTQATATEESDFATSRTGDSTVASTKAGDTTTAPAGTSNPTYDVDYIGTTIKDAETVPVVANVVAGTTGLVAPTTNKWGNAVHNFQNKAIDTVSNIPLVGGVASTIMKIAQPLDIVDNVVGGAYGLVTGKSDMIPDATNDDSETITPVQSGVSYTNNQIKKTLTTLTQAPLYDQVQQLQSRSLGAGTDWFTDLVRVNNSTGETYYRVSTNEYVNAKDVQVN